MVDDHSTPIQVCNGRPPAPRCGRTVPPHRAMRQDPRPDLPQVSNLREVRNRVELNCQRAGTAAPTLLALAMRSPAASEPRSNRGAACLPARHRFADSRSQIPDYRLGSAIPFPGFFRPGGATSSAWFRGLLRRPSSAARTTGQSPISGRGRLPCVAHQPRPPSGGGQKTNEAIGPIGPMGRREDASCPVLWVLSVLFVLSSLLPTYTGRVR
jgi:hypothetical protein